VVLTKYVACEGNLDLSFQHIYPTIAQFGDQIHFI
jgi:hypothetical protein